VTSEKIDALPATARADADRGDDVAETRSPDAIQKEIEQTRAELAETIDAIADRISPKRAAGRGAAAVKAGVAGVFGGGGSSNGSAPASVLDAPATASSHVDTQQRQREIAGVASSGGGSAYAGSTQYSIKRTLRTDRVLLVVGAGAAVAAVAVLWRSRKR
jgi:hypothetical protein